MTCRMREIPNQFPPAQHTARGMVYLGTSTSGTNRGTRGQLRFQNRFIEAPSFSRSSADVRSSSAIRTITGEYNTKITDHDPSAGNAGLRGPAMHNRGASSRGENCRDGHALGPGTARLV